MVSWLIWYVRDYIFSIYVHIYTYKLITYLCAYMRLDKSFMLHVCSAS